MNVNGLIKTLKAKAYNLADGERIVVCGYAGDFLSFVMGRAPTDSVWFTVMNNVNVCAVATLADVSAVVLCESVSPDENLLSKAKQQGVNLLSTPLDIFSAAKAVGAEL